ncbi:MAG: toxin-antitoxin system HicB family antitoxin [Pirellulales bacterium]
MTISQRAQQSLGFAQELVKPRTNRTIAHNTLYGPHGRITALFKTRAEREAFAETRAAKKIAKLLQGLPEGPPEDAGREVSGKIHVRVPKSLHAALLDEAEAEGISLNQLIVSKLSIRLGARLAV